MENAPRETAEEPVLLSWEMPERRRRLFHAIPFVELALILVVFTVAVWRWSHIGLVVAALLVLYTFFVGRPWVMRPFWFAAALVQATASGVRIATTTGGKFSVPWADLRSLRRGAYGFALLSTPTMGIYLPIPPDVRDKLIALLREASNARIVGFDSETT